MTERQGAEWRQATGSTVAAPLDNDTAAQHLAKHSAAHQRSGTALGTDGRRTASNAEAGSGRAPGADPLPVVQILLATCNAQAWLAEQLQSIARQQDVQVRVLASDDASTDGTGHILARWGSKPSLEVLPALPKRMGNANRNFLRLIQQSSVAGCDYVALSDHDDIWLPGKLVRAVAELKRTGANAYSSDVTAYWPDGRQKMVVKSCKQRRFDYLFESAGPGCTFVLPSSSFHALQAWVRANIDALQDIKVHDWLIYAFARRQGWQWHIDSCSHVLYRQHGRNEVGANVGWRAAQARWKSVRRGDYRRDVLAISAAVEDDSTVRRWLERLSWGDRLRLAASAHHCRRRWADALALGLLFLVMR